MMSTESIDPRFVDLDGKPLTDVMDAIWESQIDALGAVKSALSQITKATGAAAEALGNDGRIIYAGAGTSIRVAVQDGSELPPTFNWPFERIGFVIAGGERALIESREGCEDNGEDAIFQIDNLNLTKSDVVIGIAASGTTPFTVAAIKRATDQGAVTIGIANNTDTPLLKKAAYTVLLDTGSELIAGSTRMKAGTAQKIVLNMISTGIMMQLGRVYRGMMVDMRASNAKLANRAVNMVVQITGCDAKKAAAAVKKSGGDVKIASLIALGLNQKSACDLLVKSNGNLRIALDAQKLAA